MGSRDQISLATGWLVNIDWPRLPCSTWSAHATYWLNKALVQVVPSFEGVDGGRVGGVAADQCGHGATGHQLGQEENDHRQHEEEGNEQRTRRRA